MKTKSHARRLDPVEISWSYAGVTRRVTAGPDIRFQRRSGERWVADYPDEGSFAAAAADVRDTVWRKYLDYVSPEVRAFVSQFRLSRLEALNVAIRCPALLPVLMETPALTIFISAHTQLRGQDRPGWNEIDALFGRSGIFGVLEWLGLPASRQTLATLRNLADPEIPRRLLAPLRTLFWDGPSLAALEHASVVTDVQLAHHCHRLAA